MAGQAKRAASAASSTAGGAASGAASVASGVVEPGARARATAATQTGNKTVTQFSSKIKASAGKVKAKFSSGLGGAKGKLDATRRQGPGRHAADPRREPGKISQGQAKVNAEATKEPEKQKGLFGKIMSAAKWVAEKLKAAFEFVTKLLSDPGFWVSLVVAVALAALVVATGGAGRRARRRVVIGAISCRRRPGRLQPRRGQEVERGPRHRRSRSARSAAPIFGPLGGKVASAVGSKITNTAAGRVVTSTASKRVRSRVASSAAGRAVSAAARGVSTRRRQGRPGRRPALGRSVSARGEVGPHGGGTDPRRRSRRRRRKRRARAPGPRPKASQGSGQGRGARGQGQGEARTCEARRGRRGPRSARARTDVLPPSRPRPPGRGRGRRRPRPGRQDRAGAHVRGIAEGGAVLACSNVCRPLDEAPGGPDGAHDQRSAKSAGCQRGDRPRAAPREGLCPSRPTGSPGSTASQTTCGRRPRGAGDRQAARRAAAGHCSPPTTSAAPTSSADPRPADSRSSRASRCSTSCATRNGPAPQGRREHGPQIGGRFDKYRVADTAKSNRDIEIEVRKIDLPDGVPIRNVETQLREQVDFGESGALPWDNTMVDIDKKTSDGIAAVRVVAAHARPAQPGRGTATATTAGTGNGDHQFDEGTARPPCRHPAMRPARTRDGAPSSMLTDECAANVDAGRRRRRGTVHGAHVLATG